MAIISDDHGVAEALQERLGACGVQSEIVRDLVRLREARSVLYLGGLREVRSVDDAIAINREAFEVAVYFAQRSDKKEGLFVTIQDTGGDLGISGKSVSRAWLAGLAGLTKTAAQEWPEVCARAIDLEQGARDKNSIAEAILHELLNGGTEREVGLSQSGERSILEPIQESAKATQSISEGAVIVVSGGARGVTAECLMALARKSKLKLLVLGRTPLKDEPEALREIEGDAALKRAILSTQKNLTPRELTRQVEQITITREIRRNLSRFRALGAEVRYEPVDVRDPVALGALLREVRESFGPIQALVHGAGVLSDGLLEKRAGATQFDNVFDTKIRGLSALLSATAQDPISWICLFSSVAARDGNVGQADYAMANEVLNKVAAAESAARGERCRVTALGWGPWAGGMVTPALAQHFSSRGVDLIPLDAGAESFVQESQSSGDAEVLLGCMGLSSKPSTSKAQVLVSSTLYPHLEGHKIHGSVVLPVVFSVDWFSRICSRLNQNGAPIALEDVRVLRGVVMPNFATELLTIELQNNERLELRDNTGRVRVSAKVAVAHEIPRQKITLTKEMALSGSLYGEGRLFHREGFQLIRQVESLSAEGAIASVAGVIEAQWPGEFLWCDPAMLDAGLQLALLSGLCSNMGQTLPLAIERVVLCRPPAKEMIRCSLQTRRRTKERAVYDIQFTSQRDEVLAQLLGVEMYALPQETNGAAQ